jgi:hypothetical protein
MVIGTWRARYEDRNHIIASRGARTLSSSRLGFGVILLATMGTFASAAEPSRLSEAEFKQLRAELDIKRQPWASIPWKSSVTEARQTAAREKKPIFFNVNTGNCLGWT